MAEERTFYKLPLLAKETEYLSWKRKIYAYLRRNDPQLLGLSERPEEGSDNYQSWVEKSTKAKCDIVLALGPSATSKTSEIIDDDSKTAKELWEELARLHTTASTQAILNLKQQLDSLVFDEKKDFSVHVNKFLAICDELSSYGVEIDPADKSSQLIRSLPSSFSALAMVTSVTDTTFDKIAEAVKAELARRANPNNPHLRTLSHSTPQANFAQTYQTTRGRGQLRFGGRSGGRRRPWIGRGRGRGRGRGSQSRFYSFGQSGDQIMPCYYCGKTGHFIRTCLVKQADENRRGISKSYRGGYRGRRGGYLRNNEYGRGGNQGQSGRLDRGWQQQHDSNRENGEDNRNLSDDYGPPEVNNVRIPRYDSPGPGGFRANTISIRFRSTLAKIEQQKSPKVLIDSGATHNFFYDKSMFLNYKPMANETVAAAFGTTHILGQGLVWIPLLGGMQVQAFHAPHFHSHILAVSFLSKHFDVLFSESFSNYHGCFLLQPGTRTVVFETPCVDGLYAMDLKKSTKQGCTRAGMTARRSPSALEWHCKTGHPNAQRYMELSKILPSVPYFHFRAMAELDCIPCLTGKARKATIRAVVPAATQPIQEINLDVSAPFVQTWNNERYAVHFVDAFTAKSDVDLLKTKGELSDALFRYKARIEIHFSAAGYRVTDIRLDQGGENFSSIVVLFCHQEGINLAPSPPYAPESNGIAERLVQEHWTRARVLMFGCELPQELWGEALTHANWLRNRLPSRRISGQLPILRWSPEVNVDFRGVPEFGQKGFAFIYLSKTVAKKKMLPRSEPAYFVGMESNTRLIRVYLPHSKVVKVIRRADFSILKDNKLPGISTLIDGLARQISIEAEEEVEEDQPSAEAHLVHCLTALHQETPRLAVPDTSAEEKQVPRSFTEACKSPEWAEAIDREYNALVQRNTWTYVRRTAEMNVIAFLWIFRLKLLDAFGQHYMCKARCCARGDLQEQDIDFNPETLYAPVAAHESIRLILAFAASSNLILEGGDVANAYLYGKMDVPVYMHQPTNSSQMQARPGMICRLEKSIYGLKQAGNIWGSVMHKTLIDWGFRTSNFDQRMYLYREEDRFIIIAIVVDDMAFASNSRELLEVLKQRLKASFDVSLFGELKSFIGWDITRTPHGIKIDQSTYIRSLLVRYGLAKANSVRTPLPINANLGSVQENETALSGPEHYMYRAIVGGLLYLAVSTRPDLSKPVGALARQRHAPAPRHLTLSKRVLRYLIGTVNVGIHYQRMGPLLPISLGAAVDADWGGDRETRKSTTGYAVTVNGSPVFWKSRKQTVIALSSAESEYVALSACAKDVSWLRKLFWEVCHQTPWTEGTSFSPTMIFVDSTAAASIASNWQASSRTKHISLKHHHVRELMAMGIIALHYVRSEHQPADLMTKIMSTETLMRMLRLLNMSD